MYNMTTCRNSLTKNLLQVNEKCVESDDCGITWKKVAKQDDFKNAWSLKKKYHQPNSCNTSKSSFRKFINKTLTDTTGNYDIYKYNSTKSMLCKLANSKSCIDLPMIENWLYSSNFPNKM